MTSLQSEIKLKSQNLLSFVNFKFITFLNLWIYLESKIIALFLHLQLKVNIKPFKETKYLLRAFCLTVQKRLSFTEITEPTEFIHIKIMYFYDCVSYIKSNGKLPSHWYTNLASFYSVTLFKNFLYVTKADFLRWLERFYTNNIGF